MKLAGNPPLQPIALRSTALLACLLACLATSACDQKEGESQAGVPGQNGKISERRSSSSTAGNNKGRRNLQKSENSNSPLVKAREEAKVLARDYLEGRVSAATAVSQLLSQEDDDLASRAW